MYAYIYELSYMYLPSNSFHLDTSIANTGRKKTFVTFHSSKRGILIGFYLYWLVTIRRPVQIVNIASKI